MKRSEYHEIERYMRTVLYGLLFDLLINRKGIVVRIHLHKYIDVYVDYKEYETHVCRVEMDKKYELPEFIRLTSSSNTGNDIISRISFRLYEDYKNVYSRLVPIYDDYFSYRKLRKRDRTEHSFEFIIDTKEHERN